MVSNFLYMTASAQYATASLSILLRILTAVLQLTLIYSDQNRQRLYFVQNQKCDTCIKIKNDIPFETIDRQFKVIDDDNTVLAAVEQGHGDRCELQKNPFSLINTRQNAMS